MLSLLTAWFLVNHRAFFAFPPDLAEAPGATWPTYAFLAVLVDAGLHVAFMLLQPGPAIGVGRAAGVRIPRESLPEGALRPETARRPPRATLAEARIRGVESTLELRRAISAAERQWDDALVRDAFDDLSTFLEAENPWEPLPESPVSVDSSLSPVRVVRRTVRRDPGPSRESPSPWEARIGARSRPGERPPPGS